MLLIKTKKKARANAMAGKLQRKQMLWQEYMVAIYWFGKRRKTKVWETMTLKTNFLNLWNYLS